jgi:hypothetical protein
VSGRSGEFKRAYAPTLATISSYPAALQLVLRRSSTEVCCDASAPALREENIKTTCENSATRMVNVMKKHFLNEIAEIAQSQFV